MKRWGDLTPEQKKQAEDVSLTEWLTAAVEVGPRFFPEDLQPLVEKAAARAEDMMTPWFIHEYLMDCPEIKEYLETASREEVQEAFYPEPGETILRIDWSVSAHNPETCGCKYLGQDLWSCGHIDNENSG